MDIRELADVNQGEVVFIHVANYPDTGKVGDGEQVRRIVQRFHSSRSCDVLLRDDAGDRRKDIQQRTGLIHVGAQQP